MEVNIEKVDSCTRRLTFALEGKTVNDVVRNRIQEYSKQVSMPGFRKGKVPFGLVEKRYGTEILREAIIDLTKEWMQSDMPARDENVVGTPVVEKFDQNEETSNFDITVMYEIMPSVELTDIKDCEVVRPVVNLTEEDLDSAIENWMKESPKWESVDRPAMIGDRIWAEVHSMNHISGDKQFSEDTSILLVPDKCEESVLTACLGKSSRERVVAVVYRQPDEKSDEEAVAVTTYHIHILAVEQPVPDSLNEQLLDLLGVDSPEDDNFRDAARIAFDQECQKSVQQDIEAQVFSLLYDRNSFDVPKAAVMELMFQKLIGEEVGPEAAKRFVEQGHIGEDAYSWIRMYLEASVFAKRVFMLETLRDHYHMPVDNEKIGESVNEDMAKSDHLLDQISDNSKSREILQGVILRKHQRIAEQENIKHIVDKLLETADCQQVDMTLAEYRTWRQGLSAAETEPNGADETSMEEPQGRSEKSVIVDALGNPLEKQSA